MQIPQSNCPLAAGSSPLTPGTDGRGAFQNPTYVCFWSSNSFWYYTRPDQGRFINRPMLFEANRVKNFSPNDWHREHQIVYVKADLMNREARVSARVAL